MKRFALLLLVLPAIVSAQNSPNSYGLSSFSAENGVAIEDAFSLWNNPSLLQSDSIRVGISARNIFETESLYHFSISTNFPTEFANIGVGVSRFGDELMNESNAMIGAGKQLFDTFQVGVGLHYFSSQAEFAGSSRTVYPQIGLAYQLSESFQFGFTARNPFSQDLPQPFEQNLQSFYSFGFHYQPNDEISTSLQSDVWEENGLSAGFGLSYQPFEQFGFLLGGKTNPGFVTAGASISLRNLQVGIGGKQQSPLGISPQVVMQSTFQ